MNADAAYEYQTRDPKAGETIAIIHTDFGDIKMRFLEDVAPVACENFITLAKDGKYDKTIFHRIIEGFMIQGGDYTNFDGTGGESCFGKEFDNEVAEGISNIEGSVAMANAGPDTNGSQFYINQVDNTYLDGGYTVFGWVYEGMDVVNAIAAVKTDGSDRPLEDVVVESVEVQEYK
ncbi:MAG: peptidylprolyl isomerase [Ruminococcus sp.]|nr:peptidylprolyl isomerase [Ruminococcus sp.]